MSRDEATLRSLEQAVDSIAFHVDYIMSDNPSALEKSTLLVKLKDLQSLVQKFQDEKKGL